MAALTSLLQADVKLEMPPVPIWFTGRDTVVRFLVARAFTAPGDVALLPTAANGRKPAVAEYRRTARWRAARAFDTCADNRPYILVTAFSRIAALTVFLDPALFTVFGLPPTR